MLGTAAGSRGKVFIKTFSGRWGVFALGGHPMTMLAHITSGDVLIVGGAFALGALASAAIMFAVRAVRGEIQKPL